MKKTIVLLTALLFCGAFLSVQAGNYRIDQSKVDQMMCSASSITAVSVFNLPDPVVPDNAKITAAKDPMVALLICIVLGWCGGHRYYLGTEFKILIFYFILQFVVVGQILWAIDAVMLLMAGLNKSDMKAYINNPKLIMWKGQL
jgi:hypothetical protein